MPKTVHQLVHTLSYGDAISNQVLAIQRILQKRGLESVIYAINVHPLHKGQALDYRELPVDCTAEVLLHYSLGSPLNQLYRDLKNAKRRLIYHNLTPAKWFAEVNPRIVRDIESGLKELPELCGISDSLIADSSFNASELKALGFNADVLNLPFDRVRWEIPTNQGVASLLQADPALHLMHVGRLAPNKCIEDIIRTFYFLHHKIERKSKLWLVGIDIDTEIYSFSLKRLARELDLTHAINFVGCMADAEVKALYQNASAYLCMSEHEGFCLPVVEAMHFGLPVLAYASSALPDTVANGGILFNEKRHAELAELIYKIYSDNNLRQKLSQAGQERAGELSLERFERELTGLLGI